MSLINQNNKKDKDKKKGGPAASKFNMTGGKGGTVKSQTTGSNNAATRSKAAGRGS